MLRLRKETTNKSFTVLELLIVIAIIGILASVIYVRFKGASERARISNAMQFADTLRASLQADMVAWWTFDDKDNPGKDNFFNQLDGTVVGAQWTDNGIINGALEFDGSGDYVQVDDSSSLDITDEITMTMWLNPESFDHAGGGNYPTPIAKASQNYRWFISSSNNKLNTRFSGFSDLVTKQTIPLNTWTHVVMTFDGNGFKWYINGELDNSDSQSGTLTPNSQRLVIGDWDESGGRAFKGLIDDVQIYSRALPPIAIQQLYAQGRKTHLPSQVFARGKNLGGQER